jgi:hypothetical protein
VDEFVLQRVDFFLKFLSELICLHTVPLWRL